MGTQLRIYWDGDAPGLSEGRLSLTAFGPALDALLRAARNVARRQVAAAMGEEWDRGRATRAKLIDLQMSTYKSGSAEPTFDVVPLATGFGASQLISGLTDSITNELFAGIRDEASGRPRDRFINEYLRVLPKGVSRQRYSVVRDGEVLSHFDLAEVMVVEPVEAYPRLVVLRGRVEGVTFGELGEPSVRFAPWEGKLVVAAATRDQVRQAIELQEKAQALFLMANRPKLMWIRADGEPLSLLTDQQLEDHLFSRWGNVLERLSK